MVERKSRRGCCLGCVGVGALVVLVPGLVLWLNNRPPNDVVISPPPMPAANGYDDVARAAAMLKNRVHLFAASMPPDHPGAYTLADDEAAYSEARPALDALHVALGKPYQNPPPRIPDVGFPGYAMLREAARTLAGAAEYKARIGRYAEAMDYALDGEELGVILPRGGGQIADLVGIAIEAISLRHVEEYLPKLAPKNLEHVSARLERIASRRVPYSDVLLGEAGASCAVLKDTLSSLNVTSPAQFYSRIRSLADIPDERRPNAAEALKMARLAFRSKSAMLRQALAYYRAVSAEATGPYTGHSAAPAPDVPFLSGEPDVVVRCWGLHVARQAVFDVLRVEVALMRYRADNGRYPDRLDSLVPRYLRVVPTDVCAGKPGIPLRYHVNDAGRSFVLYSVGPNLRDDGGAFARNPSEGGDIVAGHLNGR